MTEPEEEEEESPRVPVPDKDSSYVEVIKAHYGVGEDSVVHAGPITDVAALMTVWFGCGSAEGTLRRRGFRRHQGLTLC